MGALALKILCLVFFLVPCLVLLVRCLALHCLVLCRVFCRVLCFVFSSSPLSCLVLSCLVLSCLVPLCWTCLVLSRARLVLPCYKGLVLFCFVSPPSSFRVVVSYLLLGIFASCRSFPH